VRDAQDLVRSEIALAKAEIREEGRRAARGASLMASAGIAAVLALAFLMSTLAWGLSEAFAWPAWTGFAAVTGLLLIVAGILFVAGRRAFGVEKHLPRTTAILKENSEWLRARTS
jgi:hypothetical protein